MIIFLKIGTFFYSVIYFFLKMLPSKNKIVFLSRQSNQPSLDFLMLQKEMHKTHPEWQTVLLCRKIDPGFKSKINYCFHMLRQAYHIATSKVAVLDSYSILISCMHHKRSLLVIQLWHSVGTMKKSGYSIIDMPEGSSSSMAKAMHMHENYDYLFAASESYKPYMAEAFHQNPDTIITLALPRIQLLKDSSYTKKIQKKIFSVYPELNCNKVNIVYCPTFRKEENEALHFKKALDELVHTINFNKYNLIVKCHPLSNISSNITKTTGVFFDKNFSTFETLFIADQIISDYSCVIYEAAIRSIPIYFYDFDYDTYMKKRGTYIDYEKEIPSKICRSAKDLCDIMEQPYDMPRLKSFADKYVSPKNHDETARIIQFIFDHLK